MVAELTVFVGLNSLVIRIFGEDRVIAVFVLVSRKSNFFTDQIVSKLCALAHILDHYCTDTPSLNFTPFHSILLFGLLWLVVIYHGSAEGELQLFKMAQTDF